MQVSTTSKRAFAIKRAIDLATQALRECDDHGMAYAAIDLCSAIESLKKLPLIAPYHGLNDPIRDFLNCRLDKSFQGPIGLGAQCRPNGPPQSVMTIMPRKILCEASVLSGLDVPQKS